MIAQAVDHLWQSTLFALAAGLVTLAFRRHGAGVRYGLWFAASVKFLIPFALIIAAGGAVASRLHLTLMPAADPAGPAAGTLHWAPEMMAPATTFGASVPAALSPHALAGAPAMHVDPAPILLGAWALGAAAILLVWGVRWSRIRAAVRDGSPIDLPAPIPALSSPAPMEPGVVGLWRHVLLFPEGIAERLSPAELSAILAHELSHVRRRDNLTGAVHMLVQALFWFHPLVWWLGARLIAERERACDEAVVRAGHDRETYARGVIETCRLYLHSQLACVSGASGSSLRQRVDEIISRPLSAPLPLEARASIGLMGVMTLAIPLGAGLLKAPQITQPLAALVEAVRMASPPAAVPSPIPAPKATESAMAAIPGEPATSVASAGQIAPPPPAVTLAPSASAEADLRPAEPPTVQAKPAAPEPVQAAAQAPASPPATVAMTPAEVRQQAYQFAQVFSATSAKLDQLARWTKPVCVSVQGLQADAAARVTGRVEEVARSVGVGAQPAGCKPNMQIVFTAKPQALLDKVALEHEHLLGYWHRRDRDRLKTVTRPVQAWYVTGTRGETGNSAGMMFGGMDRTWTNTGAAGRQPESFQIDDEDNVGPGPTGCAGEPRFTGCLASEFQNVLVVVDADRVQDLNPGLIADYVAMLAMAQPRSPDACNGLPSVIELFAKGCPAAAARNGLTRADVAYLTALYKIDLQARKPGQVADLAGRMADMLIKADQSARLALQSDGATRSERR